ncbi:family 2 glycosyl transferase [Calothrix sp. NIES-4071]|nr:family 2 glycosyl transferase [Calothrix sp. NIES-4071]BAZ57859.1 family 2 glycosyl transferase [Calothrix sp. NIES-4105]
MSYLIQEIEVTQFLPTISLSENHTGVALILRRQDKPIGFFMQALPAKSVLTSETIMQIISNQVGKKIIEESIREELKVEAANYGDFPSLTVTICTKDRPDNLARCLKSLIKLQQSDLEAKPRFEILVVDNAPSNNSTKELVAALSTVSYVREPKPGLNFARNRAIQEANGEILAYIDDDVVVDRNWLNGLMEAWAENTSAGAFTGQVLSYALETEAQIVCEQRGGFRKGFDKIRFGQTLPDNPLYPCGAGVFGVGCNMAFRREILIKLGGFDEALDAGAALPGGGDHDMFYRVVRAGYILVYEPLYLVYHEHRRDYAGLKRQYSRSWGLGFTSYITKCYLSDPSQRQKLRHLILWWFNYELRQLSESLLGKHPLSPNILLAELLGGITGLLGEYSRSKKRTEKIIRQLS